MLVQLVVTDPGALDEARQLLGGDLAELDAACSRFRPDSEVARIGRAAGDAAGLCTVTVSPLLAEAIAVALRAARLTNGDVDPTVGAAISALGYDRDFGQLPATGPALPLTTRVIPGWRCVDLDPATRKLTMPAGVQLDLGATVKGWAADRSAIRIAKELGCGALVSLGGDTAVAGDPPEGGWRIRVQDITGLPGDQPPSGGPSTVIAIRDGGLATSSTVARRWRRGGEVLHHILDPGTGLPAAPVWRTVSVAAATCADANTAATAAIIRGRPAPGWLASLNLPARLVEADGTVHVIAGWPADPGPG
jgi:thiamine biosynthesis lipoprotein ApbE